MKKILVPFKRVPEPTDGEAYYSSGQTRWVLNPFDEIAIEESLLLKERGAADEVVGVTISSPDSEEQIRTALAMGLDRVIRVDDSRILDPYAVARILFAVVGKENPWLILIGKQAIDDDANQTGQMLAGLLGWPQATFISKIEILEGQVQARCERETDAGPEVVIVNLPAVVTADLRLNEPRYVSLPGLMRARRRPIEVLSTDQLGVVVQPKTVVLSIEPTPKRRAGEQLESVEDLVRRLREVEKIF